MKNLNLLVVLLLFITAVQSFASDYKRDLRIGETAFLKEEGEYVKVQSFSGGKYRILFVTGVNKGKVGSGWLRSDLALVEFCTSFVCSGAKVFDLYSKSNAEVLAIDMNGNYIIKNSAGKIFLDVTEKYLKITNGNNQSNPSPVVSQPPVSSEKNNQSRNDLAHDRALKVGDEVIIVEKNLKVKIESIESGTYNVRVLEGVNTGKIGRGWLREDLALTKACYKNICTDNIYFLRSENVNVKVYAIEINGKLFVSSLTNKSGGTKVSKWKNVDISDMAQIPTQSPAKPQVPVVMPPVANSNKNFIDLPIQ